MSDANQFAGWSDEQLQRYLETGEEPSSAPAPAALPDVTTAPPGQGAAVQARRNTIVKAAQRSTAPTAEQIEPSSAKRFLAGMGGEMEELLAAPGEKFSTLFPGEGAPGQQEMAAVGEERSARRNALRQLKETPAGEFGAATGQALPFTAAPTRIPAQMGLAAVLGFLKGGPDRPTGAVNELSNSAVSGSIDALTTGLAMKGADLLGRTLNAAAGRYTPEGRELLATDKAAQNLGLRGENALGLGQLAPTSAYGAVERSLPGYAGRVEKQGAILRDSLSSTREVPAATGSGTVEQTVPGGKLSDELKAAVAERYNQARAKYQAVDDFAAANNLGNIETIYSTPQLLRLQKNAVKGDEGSLLAINLINNYDQNALLTIGNRLAGGSNSRQIVQSGIPMTEYHDLRVAINKGMNAIDRIEMAKRTAAQQDAYRYLSNLKTGLDNEVENWAGKNLKTREAKNLYDNAKQFYSDVVAPAVIQNPVARKAVSRTRGYMTADQMIGDVSSARNRELVDRLRETATPQGDDMLRMLQGVPDVAAAASGRVPQIEKGNLARAVSAMLGHPAVGALETLPGLGALARSGMAKRLYAAQSPLDQRVPGALTALAVQEQPQPSFEKRVRKILGLQ